MIEGAGGWMVPLNQQEYIGDMVKVLNIPVILVVGMKLGLPQSRLANSESLTGRLVHEIYMAG